MIQNVMQTLQSLPFTADVQLVGSHAENLADRYSDYDVNIAVENVSAAEALKKIVDVLQSRFDPLWVDYAPSLMPQKFVASLFLPCDSPFAYVDIAIEGQDSDRMADLSCFVNDPWIHLTKLCVMNLKYCLRQKLDFEKSFARMMNKAGIAEWINPTDGCQQLITILRAQSSVPSVYLDMIEKHLPAV